MGEQAPGGEGRLHELQQTIETARGVYFQLVSSPTATPRPVKEGEDPIVESRKWVETDDRKYLEGEQPTWKDGEATFPDRMVQSHLNDMVIPMLRVARDTGSEPEKMRILGKALVTEQRIWENQRPMAAVNGDASVAKHQQDISTMERQSKQLLIGAAAIEEMQTLESQKQVV